MDLIPLFIKSSSQNFIIYNDVAGRTSRITGIFPLFWSIIMTDRVFFFPDHFLPLVVSSNHHIWLQTNVGHFAKGFCSTSTELKCGMNFSVRQLYRMSNIAKENTVERWNRCVFFAFLNALNNFNRLFRKLVILAYNYIHKNSMQITIV